MAIALSTKVYFVSSENANYPRRKRATVRELVSATKTAFLGLLAPVIIIGGIMAGIFTPTEAAIVAVFYSIVIGFYYRSLSPATCRGWSGRPWASPSTSSSSWRARRSSG